MPTPVLMPKLGNSVESSLILKWCKQPGEHVKAGEVLCEIETDKATMEVESPSEGVLLEQLFAEGDEVPVLTVIAHVGETAETVAFEVTPVPVPPVISATVNPSDSNPPDSSVSNSSGTQATPTSLASKPSERFVSPRARKLALRENLSLEHVATGTGPNGRIIERDVLAALNDRVANSVPPIATTLNAEPSPVSPSQPTSSSQREPILRTPEDRVTATPLKGIRKRVADRMLESLQTTAQLTLNASADARDLKAFRARFKALAVRDPSLPNITLNHLILLVVARTLKAFPELNAHLEHDVSYTYRDVHLGFAVDTERGLLVPVIRDANRISLRELAERATNLARDAQAGRAAPTDLQGGTFTVSNLGAFGIETFTPILNPPQVAILGVGGIQPKAVQEGEDVRFYPHLSLSLTVNHQVVDGAPAARFLQALCRNLAHLEDLMLL
jgi:pyruvate dehydrogenase E2 component (dihydrolipoamide acetyltransferase)